VWPLCIHDATSTVSGSRAFELPSLFQYAVLTGTIWDVGRARTMMRHLRSHLRSSCHRAHRAWQSSASQYESVYKESRATEPRNLCEKGGEAKLVRNSKAALAKEMTLRDTAEGCCEGGDGEGGRTRGRLNCGGGRKCGSLLVTNRAQILVAAGETSFARLVYLMRGPSESGIPCKWISQSLRCTTQYVYSTGLNKATSKR
jgi:hypothetical protein